MRAVKQNSKYYGKTRYLLAIENMRNVIERSDGTRGSTPRCRSPGLKPVGS